MNRKRFQRPLSFTLVGQAVAQRRGRGHGAAKSVEAHRGVAQLGRALRSGRRGRTFKSCRPEIFPCHPDRRRRRLFSNFNPAARRVLRVAEQECRNHSHYYVGAEHLLVALLEERDPATLRALDARGHRRSRGSRGGPASARHRRGSPVGRDSDHAAGSPDRRAGAGARRRARDRAARPLRSDAAGRRQLRRRDSRRAATRNRTPASRKGARWNTSSKRSFGSSIPTVTSGCSSVWRWGTWRSRSAREIVLPVAGALTATGHLSNLWLTIAVALAGELAGGSVGYAIGRYGGVPLIERYGKYVHFTHERLLVVHGFFERWGTFAVFVCRFLPVVARRRLDSGRHRGDESRALLSLDVPGVADLLLGSDSFGNALGAHLNAVLPLLRRGAYRRARLVVVVAVVAVIVVVRARSRPIRRSVTLAATPLADPGRARRLHDGRAPATRSCTSAKRSPAKSRALVFSGGRRASHPHRGDGGTSRRRTHDRRHQRGRGPDSRS